MDYPQLAEIVAWPAVFSATSGSASRIPANPMSSLVPRLCGFCREPGCPSRSTRYCPVGLQYVQANKIIQVDGWYRWPDNSQINTHPQGLKFVVDQAIAEWNKADAGITTHQALFLEINPTGSMGPEPATAAYIEEVAIDEVERTYQAYQNALMAQKEKTDATATSTPPWPKVGQEKKPVGQFHYRAKWKAKIRPSSSLTMLWVLPFQ